MGFIREKDLIKKVEERLDKIIPDSSVEKLFDIIVNYDYDSKNNNSKSKRQ